MTTENKVKQMSRQDFIKGVGKSIAGVTILGGIGGILTACTDEPAAAVQVQAGEIEKPQWPFSYTKLDGDKVAERAYEAYMTRGGWGIAVSEGFFGTLAEEVGYPFNQIPTEAFINALAGYSGQASLCGSLGVAATCIGMVCDADTQKELVNELWNWYKVHPFPQYQPAELDLETTIADSVLCADSVGKFMEAQGCGFGDDERKERCAGVAAEITRKVVEMLNERL